MAKFRKKPITIEAEQWIPGRDIIGVVPVCISVMDNTIICEYTKEIAEQGIRTTYNLGFGIKTLEGWYLVQANDWIITGIMGEKYPCKPDIFNQTYEPVQE